mmetsp:Transcript_32997/g.105109  ORF Transcript_32997/g.105109 Transcript_32997/m.105109 type:complete len:397 (-) Transcript_32997:1140-2330(-)
MRACDHRGVLQPRQPPPDLPRPRAVLGRARLVQQENLPLPDQRACEADPLLEPPRAARTPVPCVVFKAIGHGHDFVVAAGHVRCPHDRLVRARVAEADVDVHSPGDKLGLLLHHPHKVVHLVDVVDVHPAHAHRARARRVEATHHLDQRRLALPGLAHEAHLGAVRDVEVDVGDDGALGLVDGVLVAHPHVLHGEVEAEALLPQGGVLGLLLPLGRVPHPDEVHEGGERGDALLERPEGLGELYHERVDALAGHVIREEARRLEVAQGDQHGAQRDHHDVEEEGDRLEPAHVGAAAELERTVALLHLLGALEEEHVEGGLEPEHLLGGGHLDDVLEHGPEHLLAVAEVVARQHDLSPDRHVVPDDEGGGANDPRGELPGEDEEQHHGEHEDEGGAH